MRALRVLAFAAAGALTAAPAAAQELPVRVVVSPRAERVALTIYADDLALVRETRTVSLPEGFAIVEFRGVSDAIVPHAAIVEGLRGVVERNFDYDVLSPHALVENAVGSEVTLVRTNPGTGAVTRERARVASGGEGVVLDFGDGRFEAVSCSGLPEGLSFDALPEALRSEPTLSARVHSERAGVQELTLVYLAHGISWQADYVLTVDAKEDRFDLEAWLTLANDGGTAFADAQVAVVAGELSREWDEHQGVSLEALEDHCWSWGRRWPGFWRPPGVQSRGSIAVGEMPLAVSALGVAEIVVTAMKRERVTEAQREELLDYHLYRVPWRTTVAARQSKQVRFLAKRGVKLERSLSFANAYGEPGKTFERPEHAAISVRVDNRKADGLGEPLPRGSARVFEEVSGIGAAFIGEEYLSDTAVGLPVELELGETPVVQNRVSVTDYRQRRLRSGRSEPEFVVRARVEHVLTNATAKPVWVELRRSGPRVQISDSSHPWRLDGGEPMWRVRIPAEGTVALDYRMKMVR